MLTFLKKYNICSLVADKATPDNKRMFDITFNLTRSMEVCLH